MAYFCPDAYLRDMVVLLILLSVVIDQYTSHTKVRNYGRMLFLETVAFMSMILAELRATNREFPKNKIARVPQAQITSPM